MDCDPKFAAIIFLVGPVIFLNNKYFSKCVSMFPFFNIFFGDQMQVKHEPLYPSETITSLCDCCNTMQPD